MKLTNELRNTFINDVLNKLKNVDYRSQVQELLNKESFSQLPEVLQQKEFLHYFENKRIYFDGAGAGCMGAYHVKNMEYIPSDKIKLEVKELHKLFELQRDKKNIVENQLHAMIYSASSLKQAKEIVPIDLHKYLPSEEIKKANTALVTTELMDNLKDLGIKD